MSGMLLPAVFAIGLGSILSEILVVLGIALAIFLIFRVGGLLLKVVFGLLINALFGFVALFVIDFLFNLGIPFTLPIIIATAIFGLPAVGTMIIFKLSGISLMFV